MTYTDMVMTARQNGVTNEEKMWKSIGQVDNLLERLPEEERLHWLRSEHCSLYGPHYDEEFAVMDVSHLEYKDKNGNKHKGEHWSMDEIEKEMDGHPALMNSNKWDAYVAMNVMYSDLCNVLSDDEIINVAHEFFFNDCDAPSGKIWRYMTAMKY